MPYFNVHFSPLNHHKLTVKTFEKVVRIFTDLKETNGWTRNKYYLLLTCILLAIPVDSCHKKII